MSTCLPLYSTAFILQLATRLDKTVSRQTKFHQAEEKLVNTSKFQ